MRALRDSTETSKGASRRQIVQGRQNAIERESYWPLALVLAVLLLATSWFYAHKVPIGDPPDEWAHLSYIAEIANGHHLIPNYMQSVVLNSGAPNYLSHPPLYYTVEGLFGRLLHWDPQRDYTRYRELSSLWVALGLYFWVLACGEFGLDRICTIGVTAACFAIPMFTYLAGAVNNDNLCYFGIALFFYGFGLLQNRITAAPYVVALGTLVVFLTKATGALFLTMFLLTWVLLAPKQIKWWLRDRSTRNAIMGVVILLALYYVPTLIAYHTPFPHAGTAQLAVIAPHPALTFTQFPKAFAGLMVERLPIIFAQVSWAPIPAKLFKWFYLMLAIPLLAWLVWRPFATPSWQRNLGDAFLIALLVTLLVNLWLSWQAYRIFGQIPGVQPRYYNYALPGLFVIAFMENARVRVLRRILLIAFVLLAVIFAARIPFRSAIEMDKQTSISGQSGVTISSNSSCKYWRQLA